MSQQTRFNAIPDVVLSNICSKLDMKSILNLGSANISLNKTTSDVVTL